MSVRVMAFVCRNPGKTCVEIAHSLRLDAAIVSVLLREHKFSGRMRSRGNTRGTRWYAKK